MGNTTTPPKNENDKLYFFQDDDMDKNRIRCSCGANEPILFTPENEPKCSYCLDSQDLNRTSDF